MKKIKYISSCATALTLAAHAQEAPISDNSELETTTINAEALAEQFALEPSFNTKLLGPVTETPRSVEIITREQFTSRGAQSLQDAAAYTSGVYAGAFGVDSRFDDLRIRGIPALLFLDGFQTHFGFYNTTRPDIYTLESVDIIKGPASVLYGQGAIGGIVNSNSKLPLTERHNEIELQYGSFNRRQAAFDFTGPLNDSGTLLYRLVGVARESDTQVDHVIDDTGIFMPSITWQPNEDTKLTFLANIQSSNSGSTLQFIPIDQLEAVGADIDSDTFVGESTIDRYDSDTQAFSLFFDHKFNDTFSLSANARYSSSETEYAYHQVVPSSLAGALALPDLGSGVLHRFGYLSEASSTIFSSNVIGKATFSTGRLDHKLKIGLDFVDTATTDDRPEFLPGFRGFYATNTAFNFNTGQAFNLFGGSSAVAAPDTNSSSNFDLQQVGLYIGDVIETGNWIVSLGARHDWVDQELKSVGPFGPSSEESSYSEWTFDAGIMYQFENGISPYYSYSQAFEVNGPDEIRGGILDPRTGTQHEIGIKYQSPSGNTLITAAVFDIQEQNRDVGVIFTELIDPEYQGAELQIQHRWHDFYTQASFTYLDSEQTQDGLGSLSVPNIPRYQANAWIGYDPQAGALENFRFGLGVRYADSTPDITNQLESDGFTVFDAMIGYKWGDVDFQLNVNNLFDREYIVASSGEPQPGQYFGARRTVTLSAKYNF